MVGLREMAVSPGPFFYQRLQSSILSFSCLVFHAIIPIMTRITIDPEKLRRARHHKGYSLREFGRITSTDHNQLWMYENGRRNPQPRVIRRLAKALGVEVADLLKEGNE